MEKEAKSILNISERLDESFSKAIDLLNTPDKKIIITGIGKSGHLGKRMAATFSSTGTPAAFLHPSEAVHGDLGIHQEKDPVIFLSNSGTTQELIFLEPILHARSSKIVAIVGKSPSPLSKVADVTLYAGVSEEADPLGIVPTSSFAVASSIADALASVLMTEKKFSETDYLKTHPAGQLGRNLMYKVSDVMKKREDIAILKKSSCLKETILKMTQFPQGIACVEDKNKLVGVITDGDLRRAFNKFNSLDEVCAENIMTKTFEIACPSHSLGEALHKMEDRDSPISVLPVKKKNGKLEGVIRLHDIYAPSIQ